MTLETAFHKLACIVTNYPRDLDSADKAADSVLHYQHVVQSFKSKLFAARTCAHVHANVGQQDCVGIHQVSLQ